MRAAMLLLLLLGCETSESAGWGQLFEPIAVSSTAAEPAADPFFADEDEAWTLSSDELHAGSEHSGASGTSGVVAASSPAPATPAVTPATVAAPPALSPVPRQSVATTATDEGTGWPVRLVQTLPDTQPPRAILGLPDGRELVVSPGTLIPDQGLVVMAISDDTLQLVKIRPRGDHAVVTEQTLHALYY